MTIFVRLLRAEDKATSLSESVEAIRTGGRQESVVIIDPSQFAQVPTTSFAYWAGPSLLRKFVELPPLESNGRSIQVGLQTSDDFRFVRTWWEVALPRSLDGQQGHSIDEDRFVRWCRDQTFEGKRWVPLAQGGGYSPYYSDIYLLVNWEEDGKELKAWAGSLYGGGSWSRNIRSEGEYFREGLTWSYRPVRSGSFRILPSGTIFSKNSPCLFAPTKQDLLCCVLLLNSSAYNFLVQLQFSRGSTGAGQTMTYEVGYVANTPLPTVPDAEVRRLEALAAGLVANQRLIDTSDEVSHVFHLPALTQVPGPTLAARVEKWNAEVATAQAQAEVVRGEIDEIAFRLYGIQGEDRRVVVESMPNLSDAENVNVEEDADDDLDEVSLPPTDAPGLVAGLVSYAVGCAVGRWNIQHATGGLPRPMLRDVFAPLPAYSPGMLIADGSLSSSVPPEGYPLTFDVDGILADDPDHDDDIVKRVRSVLELIFSENADATEREACQILGMRGLRDYFRRSSAGGFWTDHIQRYSKSRRKAPIYWLLQSPKRGYALWLYYHRLDPDILFKALVNYVEPKIRLEADQLRELESRRQVAGAGGEVRRAERAIDQQEALLSDLHEFRERLERAARLRLRPNLDDGVILNIAPLWELIPWKEAKKVWEELLAGKYAWSSIGGQLREKGLV